ncbi:NUDIX hydrolase [bacterium]|nr:NUDIX hydrolase [bacterium]
MVDIENTVESNTVYKGKVFEIHADKARIFDGTIQNREVIIHSGGVAIVAEHSDKIVMVKQFRYGAQKIMLEIPAGKLDTKDKDVLSAAKRELKEETGYTAKNWIPLGFIYSNPAICSEKIYLFYAKDLENGIPNLDEGEFLDNIEINKAEIFNMINNSEICDAKTICGLMRALNI